MRRHLLTSPNPSANTLEDDPGLSHGAAGDGLTVWQEYRGYWVDGSKSTTEPHHTRLSPARKELLVQVNELPGMAQQVSFNPDNALAAYDVNTVMQQVADFYGDISRGLGIDLYWVRRDFTAFGPPYTPELLPPVDHQERFYGEVRQEYWSSDDLVNRILITKSLPYATSFIRYDNRLTTPPFDTQGNFVLYKQLAGRPETEFIRESRDPNLKDFVKLVMLDRRSDLQVTISNGQTIFWTDVQQDNAVTPIINNAPTLQGSWICVCAIAEEGVAMTGLRRHYTATEFNQRLVWATAHELCHLLIGGSHFNQPGYLMTGNLPAPAGIDTITAGCDEIQLIDLKGRRSIEH